MKISSSKIASADIAAKVIATLRSHGIAALPRNYEIVYELLNNPNKGLAQEFKKLGAHPTQLQVDRIGEKFIPHHYAEGAVRTAHERFSDELLDTIQLFKQEQKTLQSYANLLGEASSSLTKKGLSTIEIVDRLIERLSSATSETMIVGRAIVHQLGESGRELEHFKSELDNYKRLATIDPVTQLSNRRAFDEKLSSIYQSNHSAKSFALIVADIDHFKQFNDTFGHPVGDRALGMVAAVLNRFLHEVEFIARTGGEEFAIILDGTSVELASKIAEKIRFAMESTRLVDNKTGIDYGRITMSFGMCMAADASSFDELYKNADFALYLAKNSGRNCVKAYDPEMNVEPANRLTTMTIC